MNSYFKHKEEWYLSIYFNIIKLYQNKQVQLYKKIGVTQSFTDFFLKISICWIKYIKVTVIMRNNYKNTLIHVTNATYSINKEYEINK